MDPVDVEVQSRVVDILRHMMPPTPGIRRIFTGRFPWRSRRPLFEVRSGDLHVDRGGLAETQNGVDESAGLEVGGYLRHLLRDAALCTRHVLIAADAEAVLEADLYGGGVHSGVAGIHRGEIGGGAEVRDDQAQILGVHGAPDELFDLGHFLFGDLDRVPVGALMLMMNWPGSVRKNKEKSSRGTRQKLSDEETAEDGEDGDGARKGLG